MMRKFRYAGTFYTWLRGSRKSLQCGDFVRLSESLYERRMSLRRVSSMVSVLSVLDVNPNYVSLLSGWHEPVRASRSRRSDTLCRPENPGHNVRLSQLSARITSLNYSLRLSSRNRSSMPTSVFCAYGSGIYATAVAVPPPPHILCAPLPPQTEL